MPTLEVNVKCRICNWKGTSYSSTSKILCEACGCECDKIQIVNKSVESKPVGSEWHDIQTKRIRKCIIKIREKILEIAKVIVNDFTHKHNGYHSQATIDNKELEICRSTFIATVGGMLISGEFDKDIDPSNDYRSSEVIKKLVEVAKDRCDLRNDRQLSFNGHSNTIYSMIGSYTKYCTDESVIDEDN